jgi:hypothetical protein
MTSPFVGALGPSFSPKESHRMSTWQSKAQSSALIPISVTLCIHHLSHRLSLQSWQYSARDEVDRFHPQSSVYRIRSTLFFTLSHPCKHLIFCRPFSRCVWFLAHRFVPDTSRITFTCAYLIPCSTHLSHTPSRHCCSIPRISYPQSNSVFSQYH